MSSLLEALFSSSARVRVLGLFLRKPGSQFHQRAIERETGQPIRAVQREVERLESAGVLLRAAEGNRVNYRMNPEFPLLAELTALFRGEAGAPGVEEPSRKKPPSRPEPLACPQPFAWMETPPQPPLPLALRRMQVEGEWDRGY